MPEAKGEKSDKPLYRRAVLFHIKKLSQGQIRLKITFLGDGGGTPFPLRPGHLHRLPELSVAVEMIRSCGPIGRKSSEGMMAPTQFYALCEAMPNVNSIKRH